MAPRLKRVGPSTEVAKRSKVNLTLDADLARRLRSYASYHGVDARDVVTTALTRELVGFTCYQRADTAPTADRPQTAQDDPARSPALRVG